MATQMEYIESLRRMKMRPADAGALLADLIDCNELTQGQVAAAIGVGRHTINELCRGRRRLTLDMAHRLGRYFGNGSQVWVGVQQQAELWDSLHLDDSQYSAIVPLERAA